MGYLYWQQILITFLGALFAAIISGAGSIEFYISLKKINRYKIINFRDRLPKLLQIIYFNEKNARIYAQFGDMSAIDYLIEKASIFNALSIWCIFTILPNFFLIRYYINNPEDLSGTAYIISLINLIIIVFIHVRVLLFGIKIAEK